MESVVLPEIKGKINDFEKDKKFKIKLEETYLLVDWIQATIMTDSGLNIYCLFKELFNIDPRLVVKEASGFFGYDTSYCYKDIRIMTAEYRKLEGLQDMGYHIYITGQGCRDLEDLEVDYQSLFRKLLSYHAKFTRIDISVDDFSKKYFTIDRVQKCVRDGDVVTRFRNTIEFIKTKLVDGSNDGFTIWFGSRASDLQIVFYDKMKERESKDYIVSSDIKFWCRLEVRFRNQNAMSIVEKFANNSFEEFKDMYIGVIDNNVRFLKRKETDKNKRRWPSIDWWQRFVESVPRISLQRINVESTLLKKRNWLLNTTSRNNFMVLMSEMEFLTVDEVFCNYLYEMLQNGKQRITDRDLQYINNRRIERGLVTINKNEMLQFLCDIKDHLRDKPTD